MSQSWTKLKPLLRSKEKLFISHLALYRMLAKRLSEMLLHYPPGRIFTSQLKMFCSTKKYASTCFQLRKSQANPSNLLRMPYLGWWIPWLTLFSSHKMEKTSKFVWISKLAISIFRMERSNSLLRPFKTCYIQQSRQLRISLQRLPARFMMWWATEVGPKAWVMKPSLSCTIRRPRNFR